MHTLGASTRMGVFAADKCASVPRLLWSEKCGRDVLHEFGAAAIVHGAVDPNGHSECERRMQRSK